MYIIVPTVFRIEQDVVTSLTLIGSSIVGAIFSLLIQTYITSLVRNDDVLVMDGSIYFTKVFLCISTIGVLGNLLFSYATSTNRYLLTIIGRFFIGMTFCETITLAIISSAVKITHIAAAAVYFKLSSVIGLILGLLIGSLVHNIPFTVIVHGIDLTITCETIHGFIVLGLWTLILGSTIRLCLLMPKRTTKYSEINTKPVNAATNIDSPGSSDSPYQEEDNEGRSQELTPFRKLHKLTEDSENLIDRIDGHHSPQSSSKFKTFLSYWNRALKISLRSASLPISFLLIFISSAITEMILTSFCLTMILHFGLSTRLSGLCLAALSTLIIPSSALAYSWTEFSEERLLIKVSAISAMKDMASRIPSNYFRFNASTALFQ